MEKIRYTFEVLKELREAAVKEQDEVLLEAIENVENIAMAEALGVAEPLAHSEGKFSGRLEFPDAQTPKLHFER